MLAVSRAADPPNERGDPEIVSGGQCARPLGLSRSAELRARSRVDLAAVAVARGSGAARARKPLRLFSTRSSTRSMVKTTRSGTVRRASSPRPRMCSMLARWRGKRRRSSRKLQTSIRSRMPMPSLPRPCNSGRQRALRSVYRRHHHAGPPTLLRRRIRHRWAELACQAATPTCALGRCRAPALRGLSASGLATMPICYTSSSALRTTSRPCVSINRSRSSATAARL